MKKLTENLELMNLRRKYTKRYENDIYQRVNVSRIEQVTREESLSWGQVNGIYQHQCEALKKLEYGSLFQQILLSKI